MTTGSASERDWSAWVEEVRKQHPLAGSAYNAKRQTLIASRPGKDDGPHLPPGIVLLGEVHDNPTHHQLRAWLIALAARKQREWLPAVVFEQIRADQQPALERFKALVEAGGGTTDELFTLLEWDKSGWPPAQIYKPLFEAVLASKLPIHAGEPPKGQVRSIARGGLTSLPPEERLRLRLDERMPAPLCDALHKKLADGHCGLLPADAIEGMAAAQRYRDAHLADALLSAVELYRDPLNSWKMTTPPAQAILIAGNGHVRSDRGVPWHLRLRSPGKLVTIWMMVEVEEGKTDPEAYVPRDPEGKPAADILIFTPRAERADPCEAMRKMKRP